MGRLLVLLVLLAAGWLLTNQVDLALDPRGVGTRIEGGVVVRNADELEARFSVVGSVDDAYMIFGGDAEQRHNSVTHASVAGLPIEHARRIAERHPDFHLCKSRGAARARELTETLSFVAADRAARRALAKAVALHEERIFGSGERTCITLEGAPLALDSLRVKATDQDLTREFGPALSQASFVLARRVEIADCEALLR